MEIRNEMELATTEGVCVSRFLEPAALSVKEMIWGWPHRFTSTFTEIIAQYTVRPPVRQMYFWGNLFLPAQRAAWFINIMVVPNYFLVVISSKSAAIGSRIFYPLLHQLYQKSIWFNAIIVFLNFWYLTEYDFVCKFIEEIFWTT